LRAEILLSIGYKEDSRREIEKAFEILLDDFTPWKLGTGTRREYYNRGMKLRRIVNNQT
jgi:hypothetical protein